MGSCASSDKVQDHRSSVSLQPNPSQQQYLRKPTSQAGAEQSDEEEPRTLGVSSFMPTLRGSPSLVHSRMSPPDHSANSSPRGPSSPKANSSSRRMLAPPAPPPAPKAPNPLRPDLRELHREQLNLVRERVMHVERQMRDEHAMMPMMPSQRTAEGSPASLSGHKHRASIRSEASQSLSSHKPPAVNSLTGGMQSRAGTAINSLSGAIQSRSAASIGATLVLGTKSASGSIQYVRPVSGILRENVGSWLMQQRDLPEPIPEVPEGAEAVHEASVCKDAMDLKNDSEDDEFVLSLPTFGNTGT